MDINNPFESGHIKNYVVLYVSIVVIMVLFFIASTLFNDVKIVQKKVFDTNGSRHSLPKMQEVKSIGEVNSSKLRLMKKGY